MGTFPKRDDRVAEIKNELPWYSEGLRFRCTGCGKCCTGSPGYVFISPTDLEQLAAHFSLTTEEFTANYTTLVDERIALIDRPGSADCIFLKDNQCIVYEARPVQCRTFPYWVHHLRSRAAWEDAATRCEGINHPEAPLVPLVTIQTQCLSYLDNILEQNFS